MRYSGFCRRADDVFDLLRRREQQIGSMLPTFRDNIGSIFKSKAVREYLTLEYGTDMLSRNVGNLRRATSQKIEDFRTRFGRDYNR
jgi:hypothetical protein